MVVSVSTVAVKSCTLSYDFCCHIVNELCEQLDQYHDRLILDLYGTTDLPNLNSKPFSNSDNNY